MFVGQDPSSQWDTVSPIEINARNEEGKKRGDGGREEVRKELISGLSGAWASCCHGDSHRYKTALKVGSTPRCHQS